MQSILLCTMLVVGAVLLLQSASVICSYWILAVVSLGRRRVAIIGGDAAPTHRFLIVIPAHNEAASIVSAIRSCEACEYPRNLVTVYVIADNCTDNTADLAREAGAYCIERCDPKRRGKGFALEYAFETVADLEFDAVVVVDADCVLDPGALKAFDRSLRTGDRVLQTSYVAANPDESAISYVLAVGNLIEDEFFWRGRSLLGLFVALRGTGMVLQRGVVAQVPWRAHSLTEDTEYAYALARQGIQIRLVSEVAVRSAFPANGAQLGVQRRRWATGTAALARSQAWRLILEGLVRRQGLLADAGWSCFLLSRPLLILSLLLGTVLVAGSHALQSSPYGTLLLWTSVALAVLLGGYLLLGALRLGLTWRRLRMLVVSPAVVIGMVLIALRGLVSVRKQDWARTPR